MYSEKPKDNLSVFDGVHILINDTHFLLGYVFEIKAEDKIETNKIILLK